MHVHKSTIQQFLITYLFFKYNNESVVFFKQKL